MKAWFTKYGVYVVIGMVVIVFIIGLVTNPEEETVQIFSEIQENEQNVEKTYIYIDLKGAVLNPGVYKVEANSRLFQVIQMAGGLVPEANENAINLSMILSDQSVIYVPTISEEYPSVLDNSSGDNPTVININTASLEQLQTLPGIGIVTAQNIIDYRDNNGAFQTIEDIMNVSGIGDSTFANIEAYITC